MKILFASLLFTALGVGSLKLAGTSSDAGKPDAGGCTESCDAKVTCSPQGTCLIECTGPDGKTCWVELACDGEGCRVVDSDCSAPCTTPCSTPCATK